jgi:hypothetical protein
VGIGAPVQLQWYQMEMDPVDLLHSVIGTMLALLTKSTFKNSFLIIR